MLSPFQYIICAVSGQARAAEALRRPVAYMSWHIGPKLTLTASPGTQAPRMGFMALSDSGYDRNPGDGRALALQCLEVCRSLGLEGLLCDFEQPVRRPLEAFTAECADLFQSRGMPMYVPERYAACHHWPKVYIPTAMTSGSLRARLSAAVSSYGAGRVALEMEALARDLVLPSSSGAGEAISREKLEVILRNRGGVSFFSGELAANYFTERDAAGATHFFVYDDATTFARKTELALTLGITCGFVLYPDAVVLGL